MNANEDKNAQAREQARAQLDSIIEMVAALSVDYDRLEELREMEAEDMTEEEKEELAELGTAAGDCADEDDARERIQQDPLEISVRSDWHAPGAETTDDCHRSS